MSEFEDKLKLLFDAQDFFRDPLLDSLIQRESVHALDDDTLDILFAAGDPFRKIEKPDDDKP